MLFPFLTKNEKEAVEIFKTLLKSLPVLALPRATGPYTADTDAGNSKVGSVLLQQQGDSPTRPIRYWSHTVSSDKGKLAITHRDCLAVIQSVLLL